MSAVTVYDLTASPSPLPMPMHSRASMRLRVNKRKTRESALKPRALFKPVIVDLSNITDSESESSRSDDEETQSASQCHHISSPVCTSSTLLDSWRQVETPLTLTSTLLDSQRQLETFPCTLLDILPNDADQEEDQDQDQEEEQVNKRTRQESPWAEYQRKASAQWRAHKARQLSLNVQIEDGNDYSNHDDLDDDDDCMDLIPFLLDEEEENVSVLFKE